MATTSELTDTSLNIAGTTTINGIESTLSNNSSKVATSSAILTAINNSASNVSSYVDSAISNIRTELNTYSSVLWQNSDGVDGGDININIPNKYNYVLIYAENTNPDKGATVIIPVGGRGTLFSSTVGSYYFTISRAISVGRTRVSIEKAYIFGWDNAENIRREEANGYLRVTKIVGLAFN